jgi:UDPglucose 6-dehydrogenase
MQKTLTNIGIIGNGFVGSAVERGFSLWANIRVYDVLPEKSSHSLYETVKLSDYLFVSVPTPMHQSGDIDLTYVFNVFNEISRFDLDLKDKIFILKSTVIPGTTDKIKESFQNIRIVFNPEFLTERNAYLDFINATRIVIGGHDKDLDDVEKLFRSRFPHTQIVKTDYRTAELIKYMCNCFFATKISFMNEMKQISQKIDANWDEAIVGFLTDGRIGNSHVDVPGHDGQLGFGGKCFPKDVNAMISFAKSIDVEPTMLTATWLKNTEVRDDKNWERIPGAVTSKINK